MLHSKQTTGWFLCLGESNKKRPMIQPVERVQALYYYLQQIIKLLCLGNKTVFSSVCSS
jgi:hypothetical protein